MKLTIIDFNRTVYDPDTGELVPGALALLQSLSARMPVVLVSRNEPGRGDIVSELGIASYFAEAIFTPAKSPELFLEIMERHRTHPQETLVIGDYITEEIMHGNKAGARTIRLKRGKFKDHTPKRPEEEAWRTVDDLSEIEELLK
ncbi:MAG: hypothetical protein JWM46_170 [Candidatus Kaiserbacteria bacterium]|nr:hypothetical protein [Candidatus Kaiserbacteria bacterium]